MKDLKILSLVSCVDKDNNQENEHKTNDDFDTAKLVETLATLPELKNLYIDGGVVDCFSSTVLIAEKLTRLQKLALYDFSNYLDDESQQKVRGLLKSKKIRFVDNDHLIDNQLKYGL